MNDNKELSKESGSSNEKAFGETEKILNLLKELRIEYMYEQFEKEGLVVIEELTLMSLKNVNYFKWKTLGDRGRFVQYLRTQGNHCYTKDERMRIMEKRIIALEDEIDSIKNKLY